MKNLLFLAWVVTLIILPLQTNSLAQNNLEKIDDYLKAVMETSAEDEMINVYAVFKDRLSYNDLYPRTFNLNRKEKQKIVARTLKDYAAEKQSRLLTFLRRGDQNNVKDIREIWAINVIAFRTNKNLISTIAGEFPEIEKIFFDRVISEEEIIDDLGISRYNMQNNIFVEASLAPQQGLMLIRAPFVWAEGDSGQGVIVANIDTGTDWLHPDLIKNIWNNLGEDADNDGRTIEWNGSTWVFDPGDVNGIDNDGNGYIDDFIGWDIGSNDNDPRNPSSSHGTQTAGIIAGDGTNGTQTGVAPRAKLMNLKNDGTFSGETAHWLAQQYAMDNGADVITSSLSFKWYFNPKPNYPMFRQIGDMVLAAGIIHTNSTSNDGGNLGNAPVPYNISAPGNLPGPWVHPDQILVGGVSAVIGVGNVDAFSDVIVSSSPYGPAAWENIQLVFPSYPYVMPVNYRDYPYQTIPGSMGLLKPDVTAPGASTTSTVPGTGYSSFSGTSGATPHVAGTCALLLSVNPFLTPAEVSMILQTTSIEKGPAGKDNRYGAGRIDAYNAYQLAASMIPVELISFIVSTDQNSVKLNWKTATELNNYGFEIQRSYSVNNAGELIWNNIGFIEGNGTTSEVSSYTFNDDKPGTGKISYRLKQLDFDGKFEYSTVIQVDISTPLEFSLDQNYPNPFNPSTVISYKLNSKQFVSLKVFDVLGNQIATLVNEEKPAGIYEVTFGANQPSGDNPAQGGYASGVYFYKLQAGNYIESRKMMLMK